MHLMDGDGLDSPHTNVDANNDMHDISGQTEDDPLTEVRVFGSVMTHDIMRGSRTQLTRIMSKI